MMAHRTIRFNDQADLVMGSLSPTCAVFANIPDDNDDDDKLEGVSDLVKQSILARKL